MAKRKKMKRFRLVNILVIGILIYISVVLLNQRSMMKNLEAKKDGNIVINQKLEKEIKGLENEMTNSQTLEFVEKVARDDLGMVKPKEIIIIDKNKESKSFLNGISEENNKENN